MKIRIDYNDGRYKLGTVNGREVDLPRWVVLAWRAATWVEVWLDRHYIVVADNKASEEEERRS